MAFVRRERVDCRRQSVCMRKRKHIGTQATSNKLPQPLFHRRKHSIISSWITLKLTPQRTTHQNGKPTTQTHSNNRKWISFLLRLFLLRKLSSVHITLPCDINRSKLTEANTNNVNVDLCRTVSTWMVYLRLDMAQSRAESGLKRSAKETLIFVHDLFNKMGN